MTKESFFELVRWFKAKKLPFRIMLRSGRTIENIGHVQHNEKDGAVAISDVKLTGRRHFVRRKPTGLVFIKGRMTGFNVADVETVSPYEKVEAPADM